LYFGTLFRQEVQPAQKAFSRLSILT